MAYAILETGGKQLWAEPGRFYDVELLEADPDTTLEITAVLLVSDGETVTVGQPYVSGAVLKARVLSHFRGPKLIIYKMRPKKKTRKKNGHRQELTRLLIESIEVDGVVIGSATPAQIEEAILSETVVEETVDYELAPEPDLVAAE